MNLTDQVAQVLQSPVNASAEQARAIDSASRIFDELVAKGLMEGPTYKIAPLNAVPPKSTMPARGPR